LKKVKYHYSTKTQQFEPVKIPLGTKLLRVFGFLSAIIVSAGIIVSIAFKYLQSPNEKLMNSELASLQEKYDLLRKDLRQTQMQITELEKRDNEVYRIIFEAEPLPDNIRAGNLNVDEKELQKKLSPFTNDELVASLEKNMSILNKRMQTQEKSYDTLQKFIEKKQELLASIPSIQPVSNKQLERIASGFGARIDPIYKIMKFHAGLDFTAPTGTPIYATGNGFVEVAEYNTTGYGNNIWIKHGYGYRTHYCHMIKLKANQGQTVKRGQVIGWVGSTGKSTGPHCHYEVEKNGEKLDPIHFFYNDLKAEDFERLVKIASASNQAFD
jgi:murein DD-endopeptidase MepM/ murein hydrolase activator NlpD